MSKLLGYTFRDPEGNLDWRVVHTVEAAQSNAAFALDLPHSSSREFPKDWLRAYNQGFRVVRAEIISHGGSGSWKDYKG